MCASFDVGVSKHSAEAPQGDSAGRLLFTGAGGVSARLLALQRLRFCVISALVMNILATYVHRLNPVLIEIPDTPLAVRWYGLAYVCGFLLGYWALLKISRRGLYCVKPDKLGDFITWVCLLGVLAGGRLGEFFFYWLPEKGLSGLAEDPTWVFRVWEGGMASHGGMLGVLLVALFYARSHKLSFPGVLDGLAIVAPIGLFFGRLANFINGELYGRITSADNPLAMKFPQEIYELAPDQLMQAAVAAQQAAPETAIHTPGMIAELCRTNDAVCAAVEPFLHYRWPSQLFEAASEGLLLFAVLIVTRIKWKNAPDGTFCALFCFIYAIARIASECLKEPDAGVWHGITQGQLLSLGLVVLGIGFAVSSYRRAKAGKMTLIEKK